MLSTSPPLRPIFVSLDDPLRQVSSMTRGEQTPVPATYDGDFFIWTQQQAAALRLTRDLIGGSVDVEHVAEELEDMGKRDLRDVSSFLARLIEHLLKLTALPSSHDQEHWLSEAAHFHDSAVAAFTPGMRQLLDVAKIWERGRKRAEISLKATPIVVAWPDTCLFKRDDLLSVDFDFDFDAALAKLAAARDTPRP